MADWFKFYENDLDETRFQYAIHQLVEVCPVWVGILSECCRHKSDTIRWGTNEIELFGFSQRLNVSVPKVNEAIKLLVDIDYIERGENTLKVLKWTNKQSEYCQKKSKATPDSVPTVSRHTPLRGEEIRVEENSLAQVPSLKEIQQEASMRMVKPETAIAFFNHHQDNSLWFNQFGKLISWRTKLITWSNNERQLKHGNNQQNHKPTRGPSRTEGTYNANPASLEHLVK